MYSLYESRIYSITALKGCFYYYIFNRATDLIEYVANGCRKIVKHNSLHPVGSFREPHQFAPQTYIYTAQANERGRSSGWRSFSGYIKPRIE